MSSDGYGMRHLVALAVIGNGYAIHGDVFFLVGHIFKGYRIRIHEVLDAHVLVRLVGRQCLRSEEHHGDE